MKSRTHQMTDKHGIHARPAGMIVQCARHYSSRITLEANGKTADAKKLFEVMRLGVRYLDTVTVTADGGDEDGALQALTDVLCGAETESEGAEAEK